jgi:uncharacterized membrane protein HdeD (DUF308 family)
MSPILEGFLLGMISLSSLVAGLFFLKFWRRSCDKLFLAFGAAFLIEGFNRMGFLLLDKPNEGAPAIYAIRLLSFLLILAAIVNKNRSEK